MDLVEVLEGVGQLGQHGGRIAQVHPALIVAPEGVDEALGHAVALRAADGRVDRRETERAGDAPRVMRDVGAAVSDGPCPVIQGASSQLTKAFRTAASASGAPRDLVDESDSTIRIDCSKELGHDQSSRNGCPQSPGRTHRSPSGSRTAGLKLAHSGVWK